MRGTVKDLWIALPAPPDAGDYYDQEYITSGGETHTYKTRRNKVGTRTPYYEWHKLPEGVYEYGKEYPKCEGCGAKYVPIDGECFRCKFLRK